MGRIAFVTDSIAAVPVDVAAQLQITVVPLEVILGGQVYRDGHDLTTPQLFELIGKSRTLPTTTQPTPADFEEVYGGLARDPEVNSIIGVHVSSTLSGTYGMARNVAEQLQASTGKQITVIDSLSGYMGEGLPAINGARAAEQGDSHEKVLALVERVVSRVQVLFLVDSLEHLQRGGRIGAAQAFVGGLLNIKPILRFREGRMEPVERVRTRRRAMERLVEIAAATVQSQPCQICVGDAAAPNDAEALSAMVRERLNVTEEFHTDLPPTIAVHVGPGALGFAYYPVEA